MERTVATVELFAEQLGMAALLVVLAFVMWHVAALRARLRWTRCFTRSGWAAKLAGH